jgi:hypothetical protein
MARLKGAAASRAACESVRERLGALCRVTLGREKGEGGSEAL